MANIIWSFGIALEAQDETEGPIGNVTTRIQRLNRELERLNETTDTNVNRMQSLSKVANDEVVVAMNDVTKSIGQGNDSVNKSTELYGTLEKNRSRRCPCIYRSYECAAHYRQITYASAYRYSQYNI